MLLEILVLRHFQGLRLFFHVRRAMCPTLCSFALSELIRSEQNPSHWYRAYLKKLALGQSPKRY